MLSDSFRFRLLTVTSGKLSAGPWDLNFGPRTMLPSCCKLCFVFENLTGGICLFWTLRVFPVEVPGSGLVSSSDVVVVCGSVIAVFL